MQLWQMLNPHRQDQQNGARRPQQWHKSRQARRRRRLWLLLSVADSDMLVVYIQWCYG
jgi:hypothetical protein